jgi:hypothetical protein
MCDKCTKIITNLIESFGIEATISPSSDYDINKKEDLDSFKIEQNNFLSSLNKTLEQLKEPPFSTKSCHK